VIFTAWALYRIVIQHTGSPVFVHVRAGPLDWMLAGAIATSSHLPIECDTLITVEHGRCGRDNPATRGGRIAMADRCFTHRWKPEDRFSIYRQP
jgi:hypothetical protein